MKYTTIKSIIFYFLLSLWTIFIGIIFIPFLLLPSSLLYRPAYIWINGIFILLKLVCGITYKIKNKSNLLNFQGKIIASKHQSTFETLLLFYLIPKAIFIHKKELFFIPIFGQYLKKFNMIAIDRSRGLEALKLSISKSKERVDRGFSLIIFPEGTRKKPGSKPNYKSGIAGIYEKLNSDVIPVALNSGLYWPNHTYVLKPGKIIIDFLPPIKKGKDKRNFLKDLQNLIEDRNKELEN